MDKTIASIGHVFGVYRDQASKLRKIATVFLTLVLIVCVSGTVLSSTPALAEGDTFYGIEDPAGDSEQPCIDILFGAVEADTSVVKATLEVADDFCPGGHYHFRIDVDGDGKADMNLQTRFDRDGIPHTTGAPNVQATIDPKIHQIQWSLPVSDIPLGLSGEYSIFVWFVSHLKQHTDQLPDSAPPGIEILLRSWQPAGHLSDGRHLHSETLLSDGRVLVAGGFQERTTVSLGLASVEIYDPVSGDWNSTSSLNYGRAKFTLTLLPNGTVLAVGGKSGFYGPSQDSVEIYDPVSGTWSLTAPLSVPREGHSATLLADGRVLVVGGSDTLVGAEIYDPVSGTWQPTGSPSTKRGNHSATLLGDGRVLVVCGYWDGWLASAEIYDPATGTWSAIASPPTSHGTVHTATLLPDDRVLVVGGAYGSSRVTSAVSIYDPVAGSWTATTNLPANRGYHTATLLRNGTVLVAGGSDGVASDYYDSALIYDHAGGTWTPTDSLATARAFHTATFLADGGVLVVGGWGTTYLDSAELY